MNAGPTSERVYRALRQRLTDGTHSPGERLEPRLLADTLASSVTPVREALYVLVGERLVETRTSDGFRLVQPDAVALADLYLWAGDAIVLMLARLGGRAIAPARPDADMADLFDAIAAATGNAEHGDVAALLNARLALARRAEPSVLGDVARDHARLAALVAGGERPQLRRALRAYHHHRARASTAIVRAMVRG